LDLFTGEPQSTDFCPPSSVLRPLSSDFSFQLCRRFPFSFSALVLLAILIDTHNSGSFV